MEGQQGRRSDASPHWKAQRDTFGAVGRTLSDALRTSFTDGRDGIGRGSTQPMFSPDAGPIEVVRATPIPQELR